MKTLKYGAFALIAAVGTAQAGISDAGFMLDAIDQGLAGGPGGAYLVAPGLGNGGGFFLAGGPFVDSNIDGLNENIGADLLGGSVFSNDVLTDNGDGTQTLLLTITSSSGELFPSGFSDGVNPLNRAGMFFGANAGGTPLDFGGETVLAADLDALDAAGASIFGGPVELVGLGFNIQSGSFGINFGDDTVGLGVGEVTLAITMTPAPGSVALLGLGGLCATRRRR